MYPGAHSGYVDWLLVAALAAGGVAGAIGGIAIGKRLTGHKRPMEIGFALIVVRVGIYVAWKGLA